MKAEAMRMFPQDPHNHLMPGEHWTLTKATRYSTNLDVMDDVLHDRWPTLPAGSELLILDSRPYGNGEMFYQVGLVKAKKRVGWIYSLLLADQYEGNIDEAKTDDARDACEERLYEHRLGEIAKQHAITIEQVRDIDIEGDNVTPRITN